MAAKAAVEALPAAVARLAQRGSTASWYLLIALEVRQEHIASPRCLLVQRNKESLFYHTPAHLLLSILIDGRPA